jgi:hypothetical protein
MPTPARVSKALPAGLLGMLALAAFIEWRVAKKDVSFITTWAAAWRRAAQDVQRADLYELLVFGDSLVKHGIVPKVLEQGAGLTAHNFAVPKGMAAGSFFLFRQAIRAGATPRAVLIDGELLPDDPLELTRLWPELASLSDCTELARSGRDLEFFGKMLLSWALPSYKVRFEIREAVLLAFEGKQRSDPLTLPLLRRNWRVNDGAGVLEPRTDPPGVDPRIEELLRRGYEPSEWDCRPLNAEYVARFLDLAVSRRVPVFWLLPPMHPEVRDRRERFGWDRSYLRYLQSVMTRYPGLTVVDGRQMGLGPEYVADFTHLSRRGAIAFSAAVGTAIRDAIASSGSRAAAQWLELPSHHDGDEERIAAAVKVEDLGESEQVFARRVAEQQRQEPPGVDAKWRRR